MVLRDDVDVDDPALVHSPSVVDSVPKSGLNRHITHIGLPSPGFNPERDRAGSTIVSLKAKWLKGKEIRPPFMCSERSSLQYLVEKELSHATVKVYAAADFLLS